VGIREERKKERILFYLRNKREKRREKREGQSMKM